MNETDVNLEGRQVTYNGNSRDHLRGKVGRIARITRRVGGGTTFAVEYPDDSIEYAESWAWKILPKEDISATAKTFNLDDLFTDAAGGKLEVAMHEIERLEARIAELKKFVEVYKSL